MTWSLFLLQYAWWHYHVGFSACRRHAFNFVRLVWRLFAPLNLLRTLFLPFERLRESYTKGGSWEDWAGTLVVNTLMRLIGAVARITLVLIGIVCTVLAGILATFIVLAWLLLPVIILCLITLVMLVIL
jgi:hypothetical protein